MDDSLIWVRCTNVTKSSVSAVDRLKSEAEILIVINSSVDSPLGFEKDDRLLITVKDQH